MGLHSAAFSANSSLCPFEEEYISSIIFSAKIKAILFYSRKLFIDSLCAINDSAEPWRSICEINPKQLELKVEHQGDDATLLNLDITIEEGAFIYNLLDKRDSFPFSIIRMPHIESDIPQFFFI